MLLDLLTSLLGAVVVAVAVCVALLAWEDWRPIETRLEGDQMLRVFLAVWLVVTVAGWLALHATRR